jgi:hypothetical protein
VYVSLNKILLLNLAAVMRIKNVMNMCMYIWGLLYGSSLFVLNIFFFGINFVSEVMHEFCSGYER